MNISITDRARTYLSRLQPSIEGSGGSTALFEAAQVLVRGFSLSETEAFPLLLQWNEDNSVPPWSDKDVLHKIKDADRNSRRSPGYLLCAGDGDRITPAEKERRERQGKREKWPKFHALSEVSTGQIAQMRDISPLAVNGVNLLGYLSGAIVDGHRCFVIHERTFAQARRLDGGKLIGSGREIKAKNLPGAEGKFIGWTSLGPPDCPVILLEGCIGFLEGWHAIMAVDADAAGWSVLAATSASSRFDAAELHKLQGRKIRIVPDSDETGLEACGYWTAALRSVDCEVKAYQLPGGAKDIGDVRNDHSTLKEIFAAYA